MRGSALLVGCAQLASPRGGVWLAREIPAGACQLERRCTRLAAAKGAEARQGSLCLDWLARPGWFDGSLGTVLGAPVLPERGLEMSRNGTQATPVRQPTLELACTFLT